MALRDTIKNYAKGVIRKFTGGNNEDTQPKQTLNEQVETGTINNPTTGNTSTQTGSDFQIESNLGNIDLTSSDTIENPDENKIDTKVEGFIKSEGSDLISGDLLAAREKEKSRADESARDTLGRRIQGIPKGISDMINSQLADRDMQTEEKKVALGFNKKNGDVYYLDIKSDLGSNEALQYALNKYDAALNSGLSEEQAVSDLFDDTRKLFRLKADDYYNNGGFFYGDSIKRRKDQYSQEQLDMLSANTEKFGLSKGNYEPTFDEWAEWFNTYFENQRNTQEIYEGYGLTPDESEISLSGVAQGEWLSGMKNLEMSGIENALKTYISDGDIRSRATSSILGAFENQNSRVYTIIAPVYAKEQVVLSKPENERTEGEKELLKIANQFRQMEKGMAMGLNDWALQQIKYGRDESGDIVESMTYFEGDRTLGDVLTSEVKRLSGRERKDSTSNIDVFQQMANEALYQYNKGKGSRLGNAREWTQHKGAPIGWGLSEFGQQSAKLIGKINTYARYALAQPLDFMDKATSSEGFAPTTEYLDQDFTIGRMIETDDSNIKRTIKKYLLDAAEYAPEVAGNIIPDVIITAATGGAGGVELVRHIPKTARAINAVKSMKSLSTINKIRTVSRASKGASTGIEALDKVSDAAKAINGTWATMGKFIDRAITQSVIDQAMDAQWSGFDTEAYSPASFLLSSVGTLGFNLIPDLARGQLGGFIRKQINKDAITGTIWDIADYMSSSTEATNNIVNVLRKNASDIGVDDLRNFARNFQEISEAAKTAYKNLPQEGKDAANKWTKQIMYNQINQIFGGTSEVVNAARRILNNGSTNAADLIKYIGKLPGDIQFGPYTSTIKFKQGTQATAKLGKNADVLNTIEGFSKKLENGFSQTDIEKLAKLDGYGDLTRKQSDYFYEVGGKKYLTPEGAKRLEIETTSLHGLGVELSDAENVKELFRERMKEITNKGKRITDETIDAVADTGAYEDVVEKIKTIMGC